MADFDYRCPKCGITVTRQDLSGSTCQVCNIPMSIVPFRMQISTPGETSKNIEVQSNAWHQDANAGQKKLMAERKAIRKTDDYWRREWHRAELHGPNDGGEALKKEMAQTR